MSSVTLSATPKGNGFQATITYSDGIAVSSAEAFPSESEAISAAALKLLEMPDRLERSSQPNSDGRRAESSLDRAASNSLD